MSGSVPVTSLHHPSSLQHVTQHPRDLAYAVFLGEAARAFDPRKLTVVQQALLRTGRHTLQVAIIGESHFVRMLDRDDVPIAVELLACVDPSSCGALPTHRAALVSGVFDGTAEADGIAIAITIRAETRETTQPLPVVAPGESGIALVASFPGSAAPRTLIGVRTSSEVRQAVRRSELYVLIDTIHEYAMSDQVAVIRSHTTLTIEAL